MFAFIRKTLNWGSLFCIGPSPCPIYKNGSVPLMMCLSCQESHETLNWGSLFHAISPFSLSSMGRSLSKSTNKPVKLRCKTSECDISWVKTTIYNENVIVHAYSSSPSKGDIQNHTCKSYLETLFLAYISNPFKGDI